MNLSLFQLIDRTKFNNLVETWDMDKGVRSLNTWEMTNALVTSSIMKLGSLREVEGSLKIPKSTLGDALSKRFYGFFQALCNVVILEIREKSRNRKTRRACRDTLAIDSSEIDIHGNLFDLPGWKKKHAKGHKAACKFHAIYNVQGEWIEDFKVTGVRKSDSRVGFQLEILPKKTYVFDRAYCDLIFWLKIIAIGSHFVTRLKMCSKLIALQAKILKKAGKNATGILYDDFYCPSISQYNKHKEVLEVTQIRHIIYRDPTSLKIFHFVTSNLKTPAKNVAATYKQRWNVELLFRWLKGHLDIRYLAIQNSNGVKIQLAIAVLVQLLLQLKKLNIQFKGTVWELLRNIQTSYISKALSSKGFSNGCRWKDPPVKESQFACL
jgi:putative transposase